MTKTNWPRWSPYVAAGWAALSSSAGLYWALGGQFGRHSAAAGWLIAAAGLVGAVVALACARERPHFSAWLGAWVVSAIALAGGIFTVITVVAFVLTGTVDSWAGATSQVLCLLGAALFSATAVSARRRSRGLCPRCGRSHDDSHPPVTTVSKAVRWTAAAGAIAFVPYVVMKVLWALGLRISGMEGPVLTDSDGLYGFLARHGIDGTSLAALAGMVLLWALVSKWGEAIPRWVLLAPAWLGALLGPYGLIALGWVLLVSAGIVQTETPVWVAAVGALGFGGFGIAAAVTALSYQRRTKPRCLWREAGDQGTTGPCPSASGAVTRMSR